jgi:hydroxymethylglutaryl-CoA lyase
MKEKLNVYEVGLRDGLQGEPLYIDTRDKLRLHRALVRAGVRDLEVTSFVSARAIPQLADGAAVVAGLDPVAGGRNAVLVVNERGYERAIAAGARAIAIVVVLTETLCQRNNRMSVLESLSSSSILAARARADGVHVRVYLAPAWVCPFEGPVSSARLFAAAERLLAAGVDELAIADTIGQAHPAEVGARLAQLVRLCGAERLAAHLHDTCALGLANAAAAIGAGVRTIDAAVGGLGGCPFAPGAAGNLATEDLVAMADKMGFETGIDLARLWEAVALAGKLVQRPVGGRTRACWESRQLRARGVEASA